MSRLPASAVLAQGISRHAFSPQSVTDADVRHVQATEPDRSTHGHLAHGWTSLDDICRDALDTSPQWNWRRGDARACIAGILNRRVK